MKEFYPYYLKEHSAYGNRVMHFIGTFFAIGLMFAAFTSGESRLLFGALIVGYGFAWIGHFFIEKNRPATFKYPFLSLASDFRLFFELLTRKQKFKTSVK